MSNVLSTDKKQQVISLGKLGWSLRRIEEATGVRRETASVYLKAAGVAVCLPGWGRRAPAKPAIQVTPDSGAKPAIVTPDFFAPFSQNPDAPSAPSPPSASVCEEYRELIEQGLARGRNGKAIWQDLVSDHGFVGDYQAVKRFVRKLRGPQRPEAVGIILTAPGEEAQVDYGSGPLVRDVLAHYGVVALPCRTHDPDRKGKVESGVGHAKRTPLKGMRFESLEEAQAYLDRWEERWADTRIHGTTKRQVAAMFAEEKPHLQALPLEPFRYYQYGERVVHLDGCVEVEAAYYSLPPGWIGRPVKVQWDELHVRVLHPHTNQLLREHLRQKRGGYRI